MSSSATASDFGGPAEANAVEEVAALGELWWLWLVTGIAWLLAALVILQFDSASVTTVGVIIGVMFAAAGMQQLVLAFVAPRLKWLWAAFGALMWICALVSFFNPAETFAGVADTLGFLFLMVGLWWTMLPIFTGTSEPLWWLRIVFGLMMIVLAFWTSGQFFIEKAYTLLAFAGIWALMHGVLDIVRSFQIRSIRDTY